MCTECVLFASIRPIVILDCCRCLNICTYLRVLYDVDIGHRGFGLRPQFSLCYVRYAMLIVGMGDTDDTSIYRDTKISRYWYRICLDTFWYRDTISIAILCRYFCRYYTCGKTFNTLFS